MTRLTNASLDFAKAHIEAYFDSDFFPKRDEYVAIWANWTAIKTHLAAANVDNLTVELPRTMPVAKASGGYRIVHQLEPLNAIVYTALAHAIAPDIEAARAPSTVAFSYRLSLSPIGFFAAGNGYGAFVQRCRELAGAHAFVLATDIADFYNRLYLHRLDNAVSAANVALTAIASDIERFLMKLNAKASQGIPVGPAASIVMAEAVLTDIDQFLSMKQFAHVRYVDDIRVFSNSREELARLLEDLVQHLYDAHRLQLSNAKTKLVKSADFTQRVRLPEEREREELLDLARAVCDYGAQYTDRDIQALAEKYLKPDGPRAHRAANDVWSKMVAAMEAHEQMEREFIRTGCLQTSLGEGLRESPIDLGLVRHALRQARKWKVTDLVTSTLQNLEALEPALPDAFLYLDAVTPDGIRDEHRDQLGSFVSSAVFQRSRFARHWTYWYLSGHELFLNDNRLSAKVWGDAPVEWKMRAARTSRHLAAVRSQKASIGELGAWDRRSVLLASEVMPRDERKAWLNGIALRDIVEQSIAAWAKQQA